MLEPLEPLSITGVDTFTTGDTFAADPTTFEWDIKAFGTVDSTNCIVKQYLSAGTGEGLCATALQQSGGYGRQGRTWTSPVGGLYTSLALRPFARGVSMENAPSLSLVISIALHRALSAFTCGKTLSIKWPNDVLCNGGKVAGISLEAISGGVCVGIGINVFQNNGLSKIPGKYSLSFISEEVVDNNLTQAQRSFMVQVLQAVLQEIRQSYLMWCKRGFAAFVDQYQAHMAFVGSYASLETLDGSVFVEGRIEGVDAQGNLLIKSGQGSIVSASSGEVHVRRLN